MSSANAPKLAKNAEQMQIAAYNLRINGMIHSKMRHNYRMQYQYTDIDITNSEQIIQNIIDLKENATVDDVVAITLENDKVVGARCFQVQDTFVVAVLTVPIYLKSERDKCKKDLQNVIVQLTGKDIVVTFDVDIYAKIKPNMSETEKTTLYKKVTARL